MSRWTDAVSADSPVNWYRLNEASGNALDSGSGNKPMTVTATVTRQVAGGLVTDADTAGDFDGTAGKFTCTTTNDLGDVFTIELWAKRDNLLRSETMFGKGTNGPTFYFANAADNFFTLRKTGVGNVVTSTVGVADTAFWHHVVATKNGATANLYLDGRDVSGTVTNQTMSALTTAQFWGSTSTPNLWFDGRMDELALYTTALSAARILAHYRAGVASKFAALGVG